MNLTEVLLTDGKVIKRQTDFAPDVLDLPQGQVYVVRGEREILIPDVPDFILDLNPETGLTVHLIEGM